MLYSAFSPTPVSFLICPN